MHLVKGPINWRSLHQLTLDAPELPVWTSLSEFPVKQLTAPKGVACIFYLPQHMPAEGRTPQLPMAA